MSERFTGHIIFKTRQAARLYKACRGKWFDKHHIIIEARLPYKNSLKYYHAGYMLQLSAPSKH